MRGLLVVLLVVLSWAPALAREGGRSVADAPAKLSSELAIAGKDEPGERLIVAVTVEDAAGKPVAGATVYAYHTDRNGSYGPDGNLDPRLFGYARTDAQGRVTLRSIRPGPYPQGGTPAHIHVEIAAGKRVVVNECWFEGDPLLTNDLLAREGGRGRLSRVVRLERTRDADPWRGSWIVGLPKS